MSENSPLFISSMELVAHAIDLYTTGDNSKKHKFIILHLANAIELILKDKVIDIGHSIYDKKNNQRTIGIWDCFNILEEKNINVKERPVIELLIDDRNTIQHRFGFPNSESIFFYISSTLEYFKRFLEEEYNLELIEILRLHTSEEALEIVGLKDTQDSEEKSLTKLYEISPESSVLRGYNLIEFKLSPFLSHDSNRADKKPVMLWHSHNFKDLLTILSRDNRIVGNVNDKFQKLRQARNMGAHSQHFENVPSAMWKEAFDISIEFLKAINKAIEAGDLHTMENS